MESSTTTSEAIQVDQVEPPARFAAGWAAMAQAAAVADTAQIRMYVEGWRKKRPRIVLHHDGRRILFPFHREHELEVRIASARGGVVVAWVWGDEGSYEPRVGPYGDDDDTSPALPVPWRVMVRGADPAQGEPAGGMVVEIEVVEAVRLETRKAP